MSPRWNLWVWEGSWRVLASYASAAEARQAGRNSADPPDTWCVAEAGSPRDNHLRQNCRVRNANKARV